MEANANTSTDSEVYFNIGKRKQLTLTNYFKDVIIKKNMSDDDKDISGSDDKKTDVQQHDEADSLVFAPAENGGVDCFDTHPHENQLDESELVAGTSTKTDVVDLTTHEDECLPVKSSNVITTIAKIELHKQDIDSLQKENWLTCRIMEAYLHLLGNKCKERGDLVRVLPARFFTEYECKGYKSVRHWIAKDNIFEKQILLCPVNIQDVHWTLMYMNLKTQVLLHIDPMSGDAQESSSLMLFRDLISAEYEHQYEQEFCWDGWQFAFSEGKKLPSQQNGSDCGPLTLGYARYLLLDVEVPFNHQLLRESICTEILNKEVGTGDFMLACEGDISSDDGHREGLSDSSLNCDSELYELATPAEKYLRGLQMGKAHSRANVLIKEVEGRGRSAFAAHVFQSGDFVCEYASCVRERTYPDWAEERCAQLGIGCYCFDANYKGKTYTFDASTRLKDPGRYINHCSKNYNLLKMQPVMVGEPPENRLRIGFVAKKRIEKGEELFYDYGVRDPEIPWLISDAKHIGTTIDQLQSTKSISDHDQQAQPKIDYTQKIKRTPNRIRKDCPIPGCNAMQLKKLADHLHYCHRINNTNERKMWLSKAKETLHLKENRQEQQQQPPQQQSQQQQQFEQQQQQLQLNHAEQTAREEDGEKSLNRWKLRSGSHKRKRRIRMIESSEDEIYGDDENEEFQELQVTPQIEKSLMKLRATPGDFDYHAFTEYLQGIAGGNRSTTTARSITTDVERFITTSSRGSDTSDTDLLLNRKAIEAHYINLKERGLQATTLTEKLRRIRMAIQFVLHNTDSDKVFIKGQKMIDLIKQWCHSLGKPIALQRQQHSTKMVDEIGLIEEPACFLDDKKLQSCLQDAIKRLQSCNQQTCDIKLLTAYCAAKLIYQNGQRPGVVENLTIEEFQQRIQDPVSLTKKIIYCHHHKTGPQGAAKVVIEASTESALEVYYNIVRQHAIPKEDTGNLFFLTANGARYTQVYRKMQEAFALVNMDDFKLPPPSQYRILVASDCSRELSDQGLRNVAKHMSHSSETARQYYEFTDESDAIRAHETIVNMAKRRKWTEEETANLLEEWPLTNAKPNMKTCQLIKEKHQLQRTPKNIQDKWRQLKARQQ